MNKRNSLHRSGSFRQLSPLIWVGISLLGLISAIICNFAFFRPKTGFFISLIFQITSFLLQLIFLYTQSHRKSEKLFSHLRQLRIFNGCAHANSAIFAATLPLLIYPKASGVRLSASEFGAYALIYGAIGFWVSFILLRVIELRMLNREKDAVDPVYHVIRHNFALQIKCTLLCCNLIVCGLAVQYLINRSVTPNDFQKGTVFDQYPEFIDYMQQEGTSSRTNAPAADEELPYQIIHDADGNVVRRYVRKNKDVCEVRYHGGSGLPITVYTLADLRSGQKKLRAINLGFACLYVLAVSVGLYLFGKKKHRIS